jgi:hypothetical protein
MLTHTCMAVLMVAAVVCMAQTLPNLLTRDTHAAYHNSSGLPAPT